MGNELQKQIAYYSKEDLLIKCLQELRQKNRGCRPAEIKCYKSGITFKR